MKIETKRLIIRPFEESDYDDLFEFLSQLEKDGFEGYPGITYENGMEHLKYRLNSEEFYAIVLPNSGKVIGNFEPAVMQFRLCFPCDHTIMTVPESPMFNAPEAAAVTVPRLERVRQAGQQYAETGEIEEALLAEIGSPMIPEEQYAAIVNGGL